MCVWSGWIRDDTDHPVYLLFSLDLLFTFNMDLFCLWTCGPVFILIMPIKYIVHMAILLTNDFTIRGSKNKILNSFFWCFTDERDRVQKKTFTKWVNKHLIKVIEVALLLILNSSLLFAAGFYNKLLSHVFNFSSRSEHKLQFTIYLINKINNCQEKSYCNIFIKYQYMPTKWSRVYWLHWF